MTIPANINRNSGPQEDGFPQDHFDQNQFQEEPEEEPQYIWAWQVECPSCSRKHLIHMTDPELQERRNFILAEGLSCAFSGPLTCQKCETPSLIRFETCEKSYLVICLSQDPDVQYEMTEPQKYLA